MLTEERQRYILAQLHQQPVVKLKDLITALDASESTIRRDLADLEQTGKLRRIHGGAERLATSASEQSVAEKAAQFLDEKQAIAQAAVQLITPHSTVFLDAGTTTAQMIPLLAPLHVTVATTGVDNASQLADAQIDAVMFGGRIKSATKAAVGAATVDALRQRHFDFAFIGTNGIHPTAGLTTPDEEEAIVKRTAMVQAREPFVLADPSKFGQISYAEIAPLEAATILTTHIGESTDTYHQFSNIKEVHP